MKIVYLVIFCFLLIVSCENSEEDFIKGKIYDEFNYKLTNFSINDINYSGFQFGSDYDEQFEIKLDSFNFWNIIKTNNKLSNTRDSLFQYDRSLTEMEYVSIQLNSKNYTLTYAHWID